MAKLPFGVMPGHWGLAGNTRLRAKAEYELTGVDLKKRLLEIDYDRMSHDDYLKKLWEIELSAEEITRSEYNRRLIGLIVDDNQKEIATLDLDYREGKIGEVEYEKKTATAKGEPWVTVLSMDFGKKSALEGSFELDWNEHFVEKLRSEGYKGDTSDAIVNIWFMEVCRNVAMEEFDGTGDFTADSEANLDAVRRWSSTEQKVDKDRKGYS